MALVDNAFYVDSVGYTAVAQFASSHVYTAGQLIRQLTAPAVGAERVFICTLGGTSSTEPTWGTPTRGQRFTSGTPQFQECTGVAAFNGDLTNTPNWTTVKGTAVTLGQVIQRNNAASYQICTTAGTAGSGAEPAFSDTAGTTTADNTVTWTSCGVVGNFTGNQAPHARVANAIASTWAQINNKIFVKSSHAETQTTAITWTGTGTAVGPLFILTHNGGAYPPAAANLTTGATVSTPSAGIGITFSGFYYVYGITFVAGTGTTGAPVISFGTTGTYEIFEQCSFQLLGSATGLIQLDTTANACSYLEWRNCSIKFNNTSQRINTGTGVSFVWKNTGANALATGSSVPASLIFPTSNTSTMMAVLEGLDLSAMTGTIVSANSGSNNMGKVVLKDCKFGAGAVGGAQPPGPAGFTTDAINCDSANTNYRTERYALGTKETTEVSITRVGGATHPDGQQESRKIVVDNTNNVHWINPYSMIPLAIWNSTTGSSVTVTVEGTWNVASVPNNDDVWIEVEYLGDSGSPLGSFASSTKSNFLAASGAGTSSGSTWNGGGSGAGWSPFKMAVTITPQKQGYIYVRVRVGRNNTTVYIDPLITLS